MALSATYQTAKTFSVSSDAVGAFAPGVRVRADCGTDGLRYGTSAGVSGTTVTLAMDPGQTLTANLTGVQHGAVEPLSLLAPPGTYARDTRFSAKTVSVAADRYTLLSPNRLAVDVGGALLYLAEQQALDLSVADNWDQTATNYTVAANRVGRDFYVYACLDSGALKLLVSANATFPTGYTVSTAHKLGGFHCLCAAVGTISGHALSGYLAGDILPTSVWDLKHRPLCSPEGMVYIAGIGKWADIYLASISAGNLTSAYNGGFSTGTSATVFHSLKFDQWFARIGKRLPWRQEFFAASLGSNQGTNITGSTYVGVTGGHIDTAGRRMISTCGCEDCCGLVWQIGLESSGNSTGSAWIYATDGSDDAFYGEMYLSMYKTMLGGSFGAGVYCGSRASYPIGPLELRYDTGARGFSDAIEGV